MNQEADIAVIGAGIVGLAHAYAAARRGHRVVLFERSERAVGASIRNFGLVWPVGLALTPLYDRAMRSREIWLDLAARAGFWHEPAGSLFLAYLPEEEAVLREFAAQAGQTGGASLLGPDDARLPAVVKREGLRRGLLSPTEVRVDPREAIRALPGLLSRELGVTLRFGAAVRHVDPPHLSAGAERWRVGHVIVCSGPDFETLYPEAFAGSGISRCKLQMMRTAPQPAGFALGPTLSSGLTIARYENFQACPSIGALRERLARELPLHHAQGVHVMLAQNGLGELIIGDSHEYGQTFDPFDREDINQLVLSYLARFAAPPDLRIAARWHGVYARLAGRSELILRPEPGVTLVQNTNGLGMTLSFGLAEEVVAAL